MMIVHPAITLLALLSLVFGEMTRRSYCRRGRPLTVSTYLAHSLFWWVLLPIGLIIILVRKNGKRL